MNNYWSEMDLDPPDQDEDPPDGLRLLEAKLHQAGARILEVRYRCPMLKSNIGFYANTQACQHTLLTSVLQALNAKTITEHAPGQAPVVTDEKWWPDQPVCRFAMGASEGQAQLQFAIDVMTTEQDQGIGIMNRVVMGGGGTPFDLRGTIDCADTGEGDDLLGGCAWEGNDSCKNLEQAAFLFDGQDQTGNVVDECGGCWNGCVDYPPHNGENNCSTPPIPSKSCWNNPNNGYQEALDHASVKTYIGGPEDQARILGKVLVNTGQDHGVNEIANVGYELKRAGTEGIDKKLWQWAHCQCDCSFWGHGTINNTYALLEGFSLPNGRSPIDDWKEFFTLGDTNFDLDTDPVIDLSGYCVTPPDCDLVLPPPGAEHADDCS